MMRKSTATLLACALAALPLYSCFSDRNGITVPEGGGCVVPGTVIGPDQAVVFIRNFTFFPDTVRVSAGTRVTWVNCEEPDVESHTSTSDVDDWDSGLIPPGAPFSHTFDDTGTHGYHCAPHPFMIGAIIVQ